MLLRKPIEADGPVLDVQLGIPENLENLLNVGGQTTPAARRVRALIDTGASISLIRPGIAEALGLQPGGRARIATVGNAIDSYPVYNIRLVIPMDEYWFQLSMPVVAAQLGHQSKVECLLGRDVLSHTMFVYNGMSGSFSISV